MEEVIKIENYKNIALTHEISLFTLVKYYGIADFLYFLFN